MDERAVVLESRIEAWHGDLITPPDTPGEAAFVISLLLDPDGDDTFSTAHTFNGGAPVTTGLTLAPGALDGNGAAGVSFASGLVELPTAIPAGSDFRLNFNAQGVGQTQGYIFGVDDILFQIVAPDDTDGNGEVDRVDLFNIRDAGKFNHPELGAASWAEGDFNGDDLVNSIDLAHLSSVFADNELIGYGQTYTQDFDALGIPNRAEIGQLLPVGWSTNNSGTINTETTVHFPNAGVPAGTYNAGADTDRTLATGNSDRTAANAIYFTGSFTRSLDERAVVLESRIEAWHGDLITPPDNPGEAAFVISLLFDAEQDGTFSTAHTFNDGAPVTTGLTLTPCPYPDFGVVAVRCKRLFCFELLAS